MEKYKKRIVLILLILLASLLSESACFSAESSTVIGKSSKSDLDSKRIIPAMELPMPATENARSYLGLSGTGSFKIGQIKAEVLVIEVFSYY